MLFTVKMLLDWLASKRSNPALAAASKCLEASISAVTGASVKTPDIGGTSRTVEVTNAVCSEIRKQSGRMENAGKMKVVKEDVVLSW